MLARMMVGGQTSTIDGSGTASENGSSNAPRRYLVQGASPARFVDPANVPPSTSRITFQGKFFFPESVPNTVKLFTQESTGCDLTLLSDGSLNVRVEDGTGTKRMTAVEVAVAGSITANTWHTIIFDVDQIAEEVILTIDGAAQSTAFTSSGNGVFQSGREVSFLATTGGGNALPPDTRIADLSVAFNGALHKAISNDSTLANSDNWHRGGEIGGSS